MTPPLWHSMPHHPEIVYRDISLPEHGIANSQSLQFNKLWANLPSVASSGLSLNQSELNLDASKMAVINHPGLIEYMSKVRDAIKTSLAQYEPVNRTKVVQSHDEDSAPMTCLQLEITVRSGCPIELIAKVELAACDMISRSTDPVVRSSLVVLVDRRGEE